MKSKRFLSIILVFVMVFAMAVTACGKKEEAAEKEEPKQEEASDADGAEVADEDDAEMADDTEDAAAQVDTTKEKLTDEDIEALKASIAETVTKEYLEPNNIAVEDFKWPASESSAWSYLGEMIGAYEAQHFLGFEGEWEYTDVAEGADKEIVETVLKGFTTWYEESKVSNYNFYKDMILKLQPYNEVIPVIDLASK